MPQQTNNNATSSSIINPGPLMLPGPDPSEDSIIRLDAKGGKSVKLDELGPMVVNTDGVRLFVA